LQEIIGVWGHQRARASLKSLYSHLSLLDSFLTEQLVRGTMTTELYKFSNLHAIAIDMWLLSTMVPPTTYSLSQTNHIIGQVIVSISSSARTSVPKHFSCIGSCGDDEITRLSKMHLLPTIMLIDV
jgi:hypothetical protein